MSSDRRVVVDEVRLARKRKRGNDVAQIATSSQRHDLTSSHVSPQEREGKWQREKCRRGIDRRFRAKRRQKCENLKGTIGRSVTAGSGGGGGNEDES